MKAMMEGSISTEQSNAGVYYECGKKAETDWFDKNRNTTYARAKKKENSLNKTNGKANEPTNEQVKQTKERTQTNSESKQVSLSQLKGIKRNENSR